MPHEHNTVTVFADSLAGCREENPDGLKLQPGDWAKHGPEHRVKDRCSGMTFDPIDIEELITHQPSIT